MTETIIAKAVRRFACPTIGKGFTITITAKADLLRGNSHPHFSVTGEVINPRRKDDCEMCGCLHDEAARFWPAIKPIIALHLSNADDGEPMHADANGFYHLAGALPECNNLGQNYHSGNGESQHWKENGEFDGYRFSTPGECLAIMAEHLRISPEQAAAIRDAVKAEYEKVIEAGRFRTSEFTWEELQKYAAKAARATFSEFVKAQADRWKAEAEAGVELIRTLAAKGKDASEPL